MADLSSSELLQKLALSRAAQQTAAAAPAARALARAPSRRASTAGSVGGASDVFSEDFSVPRARLSGMTTAYSARPSYLKQVAGFNSFMGDALEGWKVELFSARLRQAVLAEFVAMSERAARAGPERRARCNPPSSFLPALHPPQRSLSRRARSRSCSRSASGRRSASRRRRAAA